MDKGISLSVIVPVYNSAAFLKECLDSLLHQTLSGFEIICVNDGSTDNSLSILREYSAENPQIHIIDQPNGGYGRAMNRGIMAARGDYIGILESDDFADPEMFGRLIQTAAENDADLVKSNYWNYSRKDGSNTFFEALKGHPYDTVFSAKDDPRVITTTPCVWAGVYRRKMLEENRITFNETPGASFQDTAFAAKVYMVSERIVHLKDAFIHYRTDNQASSSNSKEKIFCICDEFQSIEAFINQDAEKRKIFGRILQSHKFGVYNWNLKRIDPAYGKIFADYIAEEFIRAQLSGMLSEPDFDRNEWKKLQKLTEGYYQAIETRELVMYSRSYKIGEAVLWLPRKIHSLFKR